MEPIYVNPTTNTVVVTVNQVAPRVSAVIQETQSIIILDNAVRGPVGATGPQGPPGPAANDAYAQANTAYAEANLKLNIAGGTVTGSLNVNQDLSVLGNISVNGNLIIGNQTTDTVNVVADFSSNLIPDINNTFSLGTTGKQWNVLYANTANISGTLNVSGNVVTTQNVDSGNINTNIIYTGPIATTYNVFSTTSNSSVTIDSFPSSLYTTVKYIIQAKSIDGVHACELFCMHDGVSTYLTEFATLITVATLGFFTMELVAGSVKLNFEPNNPLSNIITLKLIRQAITI